MGPSGPPNGRGRARTRTSRRRPRWAPSCASPRAARWRSSCAMRRGGECPGRASRGPSSRAPTGSTSASRASASPSSCRCPDCASVDVDELVQQRGCGEELRRQGHPRERPSRDLEVVERVVRPADDRASPRRVRPRPLTQIGEVDSAGDPGGRLGVLHGRPLPEALAGRVARQQQLEVVAAEHAVEPGTSSHRNGRWRSSCASNRSIMSPAKCASPRSDCRRPVTRTKGSSIAASVCAHTSICCSIPRMSASVDGLVSSSTSMLAARRLTAAPRSGRWESRRGPAGSGRPPGSPPRRAS